MKQSIAALELYYVVSELQSLIGGKLDKVYNPSKKELILQFHVPSAGKTMLRLVAGKVLYKTEFRAQMADASGFCMYLRKKLLGARLRALRQRGFERVVEFEFENKDGIFSLFVELFGKGNIVLTQDGIILSAVEQQKWADRSVMPKERYEFPIRSANFLTMSFDEFCDLAGASTQESVVKFLATEIGFGGVYSEEACLRAGIDKNLDPKIGRIKLEQLYKTIKGLIGKGRGYIYDKGVEVVPIKLSGCESCQVTEFNTYNEALDSYFTEFLLKENVAPEKSKEMIKIETIISKQRSTLLRLEEIEEENRAKGEALYNHYQLVSEILLQLREALEKYSANEIREKLKGHSVVKDYDQKYKSVLVVLNEV